LTPLFDIWPRIRDGNCGSTSVIYVQAYQKIGGWQAPEALCYGKTANADEK
jgi:hypothetical protein